MIEGAGTGVDHVAYHAMRTTGSGELGCRSRSCEARPESVATLGNAAGPDAQHSAVVTSGSCEKPAPPAQGDEVPG
jgi:hypothetical protein